MAFAGVTCTDGGPTGPSARNALARLGFAPAFSKEAAAIFQSLEEFGFAVNNVHVLLAHANGSTAKDTTIVITTGQDSVVIQMGVNLNVSPEDLLANIELRDDNTVLFSGTQKITAKTGTSSAAPPPISVQYTGPGATATTLTLAPADTAVLAGQSITFRPSAKNSAGQNVPDLALLWSVKDVALGSVTATGTFTSPGSGRADTYVIARLLSGLKDSAHVNVVPAATKVVLVSGADQIGTVGKPLAQLIVLEARAGDNLPVPFASLTFQVVGGGGSVSQATGIADVNGRATVGLTLGTVAGTNTVQVSGADVDFAALQVSALGTADIAAKLGILQQPSSAVSSGAVLAQQPATKLLDQYGNVVAAANIPVTVSLTSANLRTLSGTLTVNTNASGVAQFTDLMISGPPGFTSLTFSQETLASAVSNAIEVKVGPAAQVLPNAGAGLGLLKGEEVVLKAKVTDAGGNAVSGAPVTFTVSSGGGLLNSSSQPVTTSTDASGLASVDWFVGTAGAQVVRAASGTGSFDFRAFIAETLYVIQEPTLNPVSGVAIPTQPRVQLRDLLGNQVKRAGVAIRAAPEQVPIQDLQLFLSGTFVQSTDANGDAAWTDLVVSGQTSVASPQTLRLDFTQAVDPVTISIGASQIMSLGVGSASVLAAEIGDPYYLFDPTKGTGTVGVRLTDGFNPVPDVSIAFFDDRGSCPLSSASALTDASGIARVDVTLPASTPASCAIRATMSTQPAPPPEQTVFIRVYVAASGVPVWIGKTSEDWGISSNWYAGLAPSPGGTAFIPAGYLGFDFIPKIFVDSTTLATLNIELGALMDLNGKVLTLSSDMAVDGVILGGGTVVADGANGAFRAGYIQGLLKVTARANYTAAGTVQADSLEVNGTLSVGSSGIYVNGALRTQGAARLVQSDGLIYVQGDATFDGELASLTGGSLVVYGNFTHNGSCEIKSFSASASHVTQLYGDATKDTLRLTWNGGCTSYFGTLAIYTQGANGVSLTSGTSQTVPLTQLVILPGARLNVPALFYLSFFGTGDVLSLADPTSVLRIDNLSSLPSTLSCIQTLQLKLGDNIGPLTCTMP